MGGRNNDKLHIKIWSFPRIYGEFLHVLNTNPTQKISQIFTQMSLFIPDACNDLILYCASNEPKTFGYWMDNHNFEVLKYE